MYITDLLMWQKLLISGPPPPARLDHAMCAIKIPVIPAGPVGTEARDSTNTGTVPLNLEQAKNLERKEKCESKMLNAGSSLPENGKSNGSFQAVTIIDPEVADVSLPIASPIELVSRGLDELGVQKTCAAGGAVTKTELERSGGEAARGTDVVHGFTGAGGTGDGVGADGGVVDQAGGCEWISAVFVFGGMDTLGNIHGDSFILVP